MSRLVLTIAGTLLLLISGASAQAPSPEAMSAARKLVVTLKIADQYRALLPQLLLKLRPWVAQDRPEIERDYDAVTAPGSEIYTPALTSMIDQVAALYAQSFSIDELRQIEAFYVQPAGKKLLEKSDALAQASAQIGQDVGQKTADELKQRLIEALRQKGHKLRASTDSASEPTPCPSCWLTSQEGSRRPSGAGRPGRQGLRRAACNSPTGLWTPRASSPGTDTCCAPCGRLRVSCRCR
jgi:hypothetical protein